MGNDDPYSAVHELLHEIATSGVVPAGAKGRLFAAYDRFREMGDTRRAEICGSASVALLKQDHARRAHDEAKARFQDEVIGSLFDIWQSIPMPDVEHFSGMDWVARAA
jgi:hypothetical protein